MGKKKKTLRKDRQNEIRKKKVKKMTSLTRSIGAFQRHLDRNFKSVQKDMEDLSGVESLTKNQTDRFKEKVTDMEERYHRVMEDFTKNEFY